MAQRKAKRAPMSSGEDAYARVAKFTPKDSGPTTSGHIKVVVRVRPPNAREAETNHNVIRVLDEHVLVFDPKEESSPDFYRGKKRAGRDLSKKKKRDVRFAFDRVFDTDNSNEDVYDNTTKVILDGFMDGYNCSVFAYGATGAGKTFTMLGTYDCPGVIFRTMMELYRRMDEVKADKTCDIAVSYLEVYNEQIRDLLVTDGGYLPLREDPQKGVIVTNLSLHKPTNAQELLHMLDFGNRNRTQHPTDANAESSRSHAVFQVFVRQRDRTANLSADVRVAKMSLIDLAGSERATVTTNRGARFREGANINKSLLALGNCINALAEGKSKGYVPYRNSKLTRLLKDSLGGNCRTVMIAAISPSYQSFEDTYNTLNYANRAKNIKADLKRNVVSVDFHISKYVKIVDELRTEVTELRCKLKAYEEGAVAIPSKSAEDLSQEGEIQRLKAELVIVFEDRRNLRKELMVLEGSERDVLLKMHSKENSLARLGAVCAASIPEKASTRLRHTVEASKIKQERINQRKREIQTRMDDNISRLERVETEINAQSKDGVVPEILETRLRSHHMEIELLDTKRHVRCLKKVCRSQESQAKNTEKILLPLLAAYRKLYWIVKGHSIMTSDMTTEYDTILQLVEGEREKEVAWADQSLAQASLDDTIRLDKMDQSMFDIPAEADGEQFNMEYIVNFPVLSTYSARANTPRRSTDTPKTAVSTGKRPALAMSKWTSGTPFRPSEATHSCVTSTEGLKEQITVNGNISTSNITEMVTNEVITVGKDTKPSSQFTRLQKSKRLQELTSSSQQSNVPKSYPQTPVSTLKTKTVACDFNSTFTLNELEGIQPLETSPVQDSKVGSLSGRCLNDTMVINQPKQLSKTVPLANGGSIVTDNGDYGKIPSVPPTVSNSLPLMKSHPLKENTMKDPNIKTPVVPSRNKIQPGTVTKSNSSVQQIYNDPQTPHEQASRVINKGTVVKEQNQGIKNGTVTKAPQGAKNGTVTKATRINDENSNRTSQVVRSMTFSDENPPSPAGKMTFAEVVKSPGRALSRPLEDDVFSPRSPLANRDNLGPFKAAHKLDMECDLPIKQRRVTFAANEILKNAARGAAPGGKLKHQQSNSAKRLTNSASSLRHRSALGKDPSHMQQSLHKMGLPSVADMATKSGPGRPNYMTLTRSASMKKINHRRSLSAEDKERPSQLPRPVADDTKKPYRSLFNSKSKSSSQLPRRDRLF